MTNTRCRLYRLSQKDSAENKLYTEVWDTLESPLEDSGDRMPDGELMLAVEDDSTASIRKLVDYWLEQRGVTGASDWRLRGTI